MTSLSSHLDTRQWLNTSAHEFYNNLKEVFNGTVVRVTHADHRWGMETYNAGLRSYEEMLQNIWGAMRNVTNMGKLWYVIDQFAINKNQKHLYEDHMHFPGDLTKATVQQLLNVLCT